MVRESIKPCRGSHREGNTKWFLKDEYEEDTGKTHEYKTAEVQKN